jgi:hypothetical protein
MKRVLAVFIFTALGWIFRRDIELTTTIPGWSTLPGVKDFVHDSALFHLIIIYYTYW